MIASRLPDAFFQYILFFCSHFFLLNSLSCLFILPLGQSKYFIFFAAACWFDAFLRRPAFSTHLIDTHKTADSGLLTNCAGNDLHSARSHSGGNFLINNKHIFAQPGHHSLKVRPFLRLLRTVLHMARLCRSRPPYSWPPQARPPKVCQTGARPSWAIPGHLGVLTPPSHPQATTPPLPLLACWPACPTLACTLLGWPRGEGGGAKIITTCLIQAKGPPFEK